jgi:ribosome-associated heat shock protein Hsp15
LKSAMARGENATRLDKWLWHARVVKTRSMAQKLVAAGKVRLNRERVTAPARSVQVGDTLTINLPRDVLVYRIAAIASRRGPFAEAQKLYVDLRIPDPEAKPPPPGEDREAPGRPDKRQRRAIAALRGKMI